MNKDLATQENGLAMQSNAQNNDYQLATSSESQREVAMIQASFTVAINRPRKEDTAIESMVNACKRLPFALEAMYKKPVGKKKNSRGRWEEAHIEGLSIRTAEMMLTYWGNIQTRTLTTYDDKEKQKRLVMILDLQTNTMLCEEITVKKIVERKNGKGRDIISERSNSYGETVFLVWATDDEFNTKMGAQISKARRNLILQLIPYHIKLEVEEQIRKTIRLGFSEENIADFRSNIIRKFLSIGVPEETLTKYIEHPIETTSPAELNKLRQIFKAIEEGETTWQDVVNSKLEVEEDIPEDKPEPAKAKFKPTTKQPEKGELKPGGDTLKKDQKEQKSLFNGNGNELKKEISKLTAEIAARSKAFDFIAVMGKIGFTCTEEIYANTASMSAYRDELKIELDNLS